MKTKQRYEDYNLLRPEPGDRSAVIKAIAQAVISSKVLHAGPQRQVLDAIAIRLTRDAAQGRAPAAVKIYDPSAPTPSRGKVESSVLRRNVERTR